jgi:hypothetical protein
MDLRLSSVAPSPEHKGPHDEMLAQASSCLRGLPKACPLRWQ